MSMTRDYQWKAPTAAGADGTVGQSPPAESGRPLRLACIGTGMMGQFHLKHLMTVPQVAVTAVCDVDRHHLRQAQEIMQAAGQPACTAVRDFRDLLNDKELDAALISTPDHWHAVQSIMAVRHGLDVYVEKPFTLTVAEGRAVCEAVRETGRVCQVGCQQRSSAEFRKACELIRNGCLGAVESVEVVIPPNNREPPGTVEPMPIPDSLDYDLWLGPAPDAPYHESRCHYCFRFISDYSGGQLTNWGVHMVDIVQWALGTDTGGAVAVHGSGHFPEGPLFDTADRVDVTWNYANGVRVHCSSGLPPRIVFTCARGSLTVGRGVIETTPAELLAVPLPEGAIRLRHSDDHYHDFFDSVRSRRETVCPAETGHRSTTLCLIANIAIRLGRLLEWNPVTERFVSAPDANALLSRPLRGPWRLE